MSLSGEESRVWEKSRLSVLSTANIISIHPFRRIVYNFSKFLKRKIEKKRTEINCKKFRIQLTIYGL